MGYILWQKQKSNILFLNLSPLLQGRCVLHMTIQHIVVRFKYNDQNCIVKNLVFPLDSAYRWLSTMCDPHAQHLWVFKMECQFCQIDWLIDVGGCNLEDPSKLSVSLPFSLCISHIQYNHNKQRGRNRKPQLACLIINMYEGIWIMWFCNNKLSFLGKGQ